MLFASLTKMAAILPRFEGDVASLVCRGFETDPFRRKWRRFAGSWFVSLQVAERTTRARDIHATLLKILENCENLLYV